MGAPLLIHSGVGAGNEWDLVRERIGDARTPDLIAFGEEPVPDGRWSHVDQLRPFLPAVVCGASYGGQVALRLASACPDQVERLVLLAPDYEPWDPSAERSAFGAEEERLFESGDVDAAVELNVRTWAPAGFEDLVRANQRRAYEHQGPLEEWSDDPPIRLERLRMPVTVLVGDADMEDFPAIARLLADELPHAELRVLPGAGHLLALERPDDVARALRGD